MQIVLHKLKFTLKQFGVYYYTINEIRELEDLPPVENGDKPFISGDLYPIDTPLELRKSLKGGDKDDNEKIFSNQKENG